MKLCCGKWFCDETGVYKMAPSKADPDVLIRIEATHQQIMPTGIIENIETGEQKYIISFSVRRGGKYVWKNIKVEPAICCSKTKIISISNLGVAITDNTSKQMVSFLADMYRLNQEKIPLQYAVSHLGWVKNRFFPYAKEIIFDGDNEQEKIVKAIDRVGDFEIWKSACRHFRRNLDVRLMMDASLASALLEKIGGLCFAVLFWGPSGTGKTVALLTSASIWGNPDLLYTSVDNTINYFTNRAAFLKNLPVLIDETQLSKGDMDKLLYSMAEGKTRGRLGRDSRERNSKTWECISIFTGEKPMVDTHSGAGAINRVLEIEIPEPLFEDFQFTLETVRGNYGHAGQKFVEYIQQADVNVLREEYREICRELGEYDSTGKQIQNLAFLVLADRIAERCIFEGEEALQMSAISGIMKSSKEISEAERAYEFIVGWIAANKNYFNEESPKIYGKLEGSSCLFNRNEFIRVLTENGYNFDSIKKEWDKQGYLRRASTGKFATRTTVYGGPKTYYIKICFIDLDQAKDFIQISKEEQQTLPFLEAKAGM